MYSYIHCHYGISGYLKWLRHCTLALYDLASTDLHSCTKRSRYFNPASLALVTYKLGGGWNFKKHFGVLWQKGWKDLREINDMSQVT